MITKPIIANNTKNLRKENENGTAFAVLMAFTVKGSVIPPYPILTE